MAIDPSDNHTSAVVTEIYSIFPEVVSTQPDSDATRVSTRPIINVTFSEAMDESTINDDSFIVTDEFGGTVFGALNYNATTDTVSFVPSDPITGEVIPLHAGGLYRVTITTDIHDAIGNPLSEEYTWTFTTWFSMTIIVHDVVDRGLQLPDSEFTITPNPLTLNGSLIVQDNGELDESEIDGRIEIGNVELGTYVLSESVVPPNYAKVYDNLIYTVHESNPGGVKFFGNRDTTVTIEDLPPIDVPAPHLTSAQLELYAGEATIGIFDGIQGDELSSPAPIDQVDDLDVALPAFLINAGTLAEVDLSGLSSLVFTLTAPAGSSGADIFNSFDIPTYPAAEEDIADEVVYLAPAIAIPFEDSKDNFILTPIIAKVHPGQTLFMAQPSFVESKVAKFERVNMTFAVEGNGIGFSFGITDTRPPGTTPPPLDAKALFLDIGFVGDVDFSDPNAFASPPRIDILVDKTISGFDELPDGCSDFVMLLFDEEDEEWHEVQKLRNPTLDTGADTAEDQTDDKCGFTLEPPHFSKFAVGGVKGSTLVTESVAPSAGHAGRSSSTSTSIQQMVSGNDIVVTSNVGTESVTVRFENVQPGSGQLKIESSLITRFEGLFDEITDLQRENQKQGKIHLNDAQYTTVGTVFEIDSTKVKYNGTFDITIPYSEDMVSMSSKSESDVKLLHYNRELGQWEDATISVDGITNTVTGRMSSSSPVVAALIIGDKPVKRIGISGITLFNNPDLDSQSWQISRGERATLTTTIENMQPISSDGQSLVFIIQTIDQNGVTVGISFKTLVLADTSKELTESWVEDDPGMYRIQVLLWTDLDNPEALSNVAFTPMIEVT
jgi:hypothetical protein